jgi:Uri superfamily endonuclease
MDKGVYALVFSNRPCSLSVGRLGVIRFRKGWHIYIGSAGGPGGFTRVSRHRHLALLRDRPPRWHVDRLLLSPCFTLRYAVCAPSPGNLECALARAVGGEEVPFFGSSDCACGSHLLYRASDPVDEVRGAMTFLGLTPVSTTLKKV